MAAGYRHIDTATGYHNEAEVGRAIKASGIARDQLFVTTKLAKPDLQSGDVRGAIERSLEALGLDHVNLYLIHWPMPALDKYVSAWEQFITFKQEGLATAIGVSNFQIAHLQRIIAETGVAPAVDQVELHPVFQQKELREYLDSQDINVEAWGPLGQGRFDPDSYPALASAAAAHHKSSRQVMLRWHMQSGTIAIPKASSRPHMDQNFDIFDFELTADEMAAIGAMDGGHRLGGDPDTVNS